MSTPETPSLKTPDPILTTEQLGASVGALIANVAVLWPSLHITDAQRVAGVGLITTLWFLGTLAHAAYTRGKRATAQAVAAQPIRVIAAPAPAAIVGAVSKRVRPSRAKTPPAA